MNRDPGQKKSDMSLDKAILNSVVKITLVKGPHILPMAGIWLQIVGALVKANQIRCGFWGPHMTSCLYIYIFYIY